MEKWWIVNLIHTYIHTTIHTYMSTGVLTITGRVKEQYKLQNGKYCVPSPIENALQLSPYVLQACIYGDNRPFNTALIVPDSAKLAARLNADPSTVLSTHKQAVKDLLMVEVQTYCTQNGIKAYERVCWERGRERKRGREREKRIVWSGLLYCSLAASFIARPIGPLTLTHLSLDISIG